MLTSYENKRIDLGYLTASVSPTVKWGHPSYLPSLSYRAVVGTKDECGRRRPAAVLIVSTLVTVRTLK